MNDDMSNQDSNTSKSISEKNIPAFDQQDVADYLRRHPAFFEDKPTLLADLRVPHTAGTAVSLVERQVTVLRERNDSLQEKLDGLLQVARDNDKLNALLHKLILRIIEADSLSDLLVLVEKRLCRDFSADLVAVRLLGTVNDAEVANSDVMPADADAFRGLFRRLLTVGKPYCGKLDAEQLHTLFGERSEDVVSSALLPLGIGGELGVMVIGSFERDRYHAGVDTAFLQNLADVVGAAMTKFVSKD